MVLTTMDKIAIGLITIFGVIGLVRGFVKEVLSILSHIVAIVASFRFYPQIHDTIGGVFPKQFQPYGKLFSFIIIYIAVIAAFLVIERILATALVALHLRFLDRILGLLFGAAKGLIIASVIFIAVVTFFPHAEKRMKEGPTYMLLRRTGDYVIYLAPEKFRDKFLSRGLLGETPWSESQQ